MLFSIAFIAFSSLFVLYVWRYYENVKRYPNGPRPYPFVGNLLSLDVHKIHEEIPKLSKTYGSVFTLWLPRPYVVLTDHKSIKEAFATKGDDFAGRSGIFPDTVFQNVTNGGVIMSEGENWKEQRRLSLHILRDFGMGKNLMEQQVLLSAQELLAHLESIKNKDEVCLRTPIQVSVANIINQTLFGFSYKYDKCERLMSVVDEITEVFKELKASKLTLIGQAFPAIYRLPFVGYMAKDRIHNMLSGTRRLIIEDCERALKSYSPDQEPECLVQAYFQKMQSNSSLDYDNLLNVCMDFFMAGMETTTTTLRWSTLLLASNLEAQEKIRKEILSVIGPKGVPSTSYRSMMPYTNAAINELQRRANIVQQNATHRTVKETSVGGFKIPADTLVLGDIHHVLGYSPIYKDAHEFRPERFLMDDGITANKEAVEQLCPFSIGKRQCAGEALARVELFIGVVTLLQHYKIEPAKAHPIDLEPIPAVALFPKEQPLRLVPLTH
ncbi:hypothetical protein Q1695_003882 [Nippostrongylus brasiliensis]|nr:hypothetical protein Q1695_003882 [Nippostrongylus brasiliensis]